MITAPATTPGTCQSCKRTGTKRHTVTVGTEARVMCPACAAHWEP